jgi:predicted RNase H-like HicB family nuclease
VSKAFLDTMKMYDVLVEKGEDGFLIAEVIGLPGCRTQAKTYPQLMKRLKEATTLYLRATCAN